MLRVQQTAPAAATRAPRHAELTAAMFNAVRAWLNTEPDAFALAGQVPALELAFAANVRNHDTELSARLQNAMARLNDTRVLKTIALENLAALLDLNVHLWQFTNADAYHSAARRLTNDAIARFDTEREIFRADATGDANVFCADANARMAEALYRAWRALDDAAARSIAGTVLGQVSDAFVAGEGLYQRLELPGGARSDTQHIPAYANAMQMFLTASETTGRGSYVSRACILADFVLAQTWASAAQLKFDERAMLADALARLYVKANVDAYRNAARECLTESRDVPNNENSASFALTLERYRAVVR